MNKKLKFLTCFLPLYVLAALAGNAENSKAVTKINVDVKKTGITISPMLYGLMTEEINHSYDGGLYAELIQNRSFKDNAENPVHWSLFEENGGKGAIVLSHDKPLNAAQTVSLKMTVDALNGGKIGIANDGYWGIPVKPNTSYRVSFYARTSDNFSGRLTAAIVSDDNKTVYAKALIPSVNGNWHKYETVLKTGKVNPSLNNRFVLYTDNSKTGSVYFTMVSLFPPTYKNRSNGFRIDLMEKMAALKPAFLRFPGGNYLEGNTIPERFEWKKTIGDISERPGHPGCWGYRSSDGMGMNEFLAWCDELHMEPVLAVYAGYSLWGAHVTPGPDLEPYIKDALDEIEYVTGDPKTTYWGALRAKYGHPKPFKLRYVEIGNEDFFDRSGSYVGRYNQFYKAIKAKYPHLALIATTWGKFDKVDMVDDHYYRDVNGSIRAYHQYDSYDRNGPKIFVGEWATTIGSPTPTMQASVADAVWLLGMERNADLIPISCYAPLFVNVNPGAAQWGTNLIGYNALNSFGSPSYYIQAMFAKNKGDRLLPVTVTSPVLEWHPHGSVGVGTWKTQAEFMDIKVNNYTDNKPLLQNSFENPPANWKEPRGKWSLENGVYKQSSEDEDCHAVAGDPSWQNYSYHVKARKTGGKEGFLIFFHYLDRDNCSVWNIGGWENTRSGITISHNGISEEVATNRNVTIEPNRWYDIRIDLHDGKIECYLDNILVMSADDKIPGSKGPVFSSASRDIKTGDIIIKVVNTDKTSQPLSIDLAGVKSVSKSVSLEYISGEPSGINTIDKPNNIVPHRNNIAVQKPSFAYTAPAMSVSVFRVKPQ